MPDFQACTDEVDHARRINDDLQDLVEHHCRLCDLLHKRAERPAYREDQFYLGSPSVMGASRILLCDLQPHLPGRNRDRTNGSLRTEGRDPVLDRRSSLHEVQTTELRLDRKWCNRPTADADGRGGLSGDRDQVSAPP